MPPRHILIERVICAPVLYRGKLIDLLEMANSGLSSLKAELLRQELTALRDRNLQESTFEERADLVAKLGIKILPSEDLKSRRILCWLKPRQSE